jgi:hypothetical protein
VAAAASADASEAGAALSATNAAASATNAATSATNAANSATASATSATNSANSATSAATSATNAAAEANLAKDWATKLVTTVDGVEFSSKYYAQQAAATAASINPANFATAAQGTRADTAFGWGNHALAGYAADNAVVKLTGNQTIAGTKTFSSPVAGDITGNAATVTNGVYLNATQTLTNKTLTSPALTDPSYTGTLTGGTGVINIGSGQLYKDASGNVGIGTSSPQGRLHVTGGDFCLGYDDRIRVFSAGTFPEDTLLQNYYDNNGNDTLLLKPGGLSGGGQIIFAGRTGSERARIDSSGNLLVGTTTASARLTLQQSGSQDVIRVNIGTAAAGYVSLGSGTTMLPAYFATSNGSVFAGQISCSGSSTSYQTSSDYRLKHDIKPMTGALAKVAQLKPVTYKWNVDDSESQGFIAHELQEVVPECVSGEKDAVDADGKPVYQGIDTSFLVATLVAAIQEQQAMIKDLQTRIEALEGTQP